MDSQSRKPTITLRRHSTSPSAAGRAVIGCVSGTKNTLTSKYRSMKSNPYVGWFRHSPPTAPRVRLSNRNWASTTSLPASLADCKNSPHIGWFRHAPPSRLDVLQGAQDHQPLSAEEKDLLWTLLQELNPSLKNVQRDSLVVSGYLRGGGKDYMEKTRTRSRSSSALKELSESSAEGTMSTVNALSRLASWFLFPVAYDAESCGYRHDDHYRRSKKSKKHNKDNGGLSQLLAPYLPSFLEEPPLAVSTSTYSKYGTRVDDASDCEASDDDSLSSSESESSVHSMENSHPSSKPSQDLSLSVSSLAEAYYAHQSTTKELTERVHPTSFAGSISPHRLDYVITQMDIARMTRNASRHLDVQSILSLPVITYQKGPSRTGFSSTMSWTIVEETEGNAEDQGANQEEVDFCVICLEHFVNGDRLRVLPCDHSFHVGCIDRWLSGSQSFEECYTSGCPTCKKRPTFGGDKPRAHSFCEPTSQDVREGKHRSGSLDGSVPSWAFAQIGSALVQAQDQGTSICSGASSSSS